MLHSAVVFLRMDQNFKRAHPQDRLIRDCDSAFRQQILDVEKAQCEPEIKLDRLMDDLGREPTTLAAESRHSIGYRAAERTASLRRVTMPFRAQDRTPTTRGQRAREFGDLMSQAIPTNIPAMRASRSFFCFEPTSRKPSFARPTRAIDLRWR